MNDADKDRIWGREWAEYILDDVLRGSDDYQEGFWRHIRKELPREKEKKPIAAMADEQSKVFGNSTIEFGKHIGTRYDDVPLDYLEWLVDQNAVLARYLNSRRIREERREAE